MRYELSYHLMAVFAMVLWGGAPACTKVLYSDFTAIQTLFLKYFIGYLTMIVLCRKPVKTQNWRDELVLFLCGLSGMTLCYLCQNLALLDASSATVTVMYNTAPIFVMLFSMIVMRRRSGLVFWLGCGLCMLGAWMVAFNGLGFLQGNVRGILLALLAALMWATYIILSERLGSRYELKAAMRRIFFYGVLTQIPLLLWEGKRFPVQAMLEPQAALMILYLGVFGAAISYVLWNLCIMRLGSAKTNIYQYLYPFFAMVISALTIHEVIGPYQWLGAALTIVGVVVSQRDKQLQRNKQSLS